MPTTKSILTQDVIIAANSAGVDLHKFNKAIYDGQSLDEVLKVSNEKQSEQEIAVIKTYVEQLKELKLKSDTKEFEKLQAVAQSMDPAFIEKIKTLNMLDEKQREAFKQELEAAEEKHEKLMQEQNQKLTDIQGKLKQAQEKQKEAQAQVKKLEEDLTKRIAEQTAKAEAEKVDLTTQVADKSKEIEGNTKSINELENKRAELQVKIDELKKNIEKKQTEIKGIDGKIKGKEKEIEKLNGEVEKQQAAIDDIDQEIKNKTKEIDGINKEIANNKAEIKDLKNYQGTKETKLAELKSNLRELSKSSDDARKLNTQLRDDRAEKGRHSRETRRELMKKQLLSMLPGSTVTKDEINNLKLQLAGDKKALRTARQLHKKQQLLVQKAEAAENKFKTEIDKVLKQLDKIDSQLKAAGQKTDVLAGKLETANLEKSFAVKRQETAQSKKEALNKQLLKASNERADLEKEIEAVKAAQNELAGQLSTETDGMTSVQTDLDGAKKRAEELDKELKNLTKQLDAKNKEIEDLPEKIRNADKDLTAAKLGVLYVDKEIATIEQQQVEGNANLGKLQRQGNEFKLRKEFFTQHESVKSVLQTPPTLPAAAMKDGLKQVEPKSDNAPLTEDRNAFETALMKAYSDTKTPRPKGIEVKRIDDGYALVHDGVKKVEVTNEGGVTGFLSEKPTDEEIKQMAKDMIIAYKASGKSDKNIMTVTGENKALVDAIKVEANSQGLKFQTPKAASTVSLTEQQQQSTAPSMGRK